MPAVARRAQQARQDLEQAFLDLQRRCRVAGVPCGGRKQRTDLRGKPRIVACPASPSLKAFVQTLVQRAEAIRNGDVKPNEDNMLAITTDTGWRICSRI